MSTKYFCDICSDVAFYRLVTEFMIVPISAERTIKYRHQGEFCVKCAAEYQDKLPFVLCEELKVSL